MASCRPQSFSSPRQPYCTHHHSPFFPKNRKRIPRHPFSAFHPFRRHQPCRSDSFGRTDMSSASSLRRRVPASRRDQTHRNPWVDTHPFCSFSCHTKSALRFGDYQYFADKTVRQNPHLPAYRQQGLLPRHYRQDTPPALKELRVVLRQMALPRVVAQSRTGS